MNEILIDDDYLHLELECVEGIPFLHLDVKKWSHNILKNHFYPTWLDVLDKMKTRGFHAVLAVYPEEQTKIGKFHHMMGMHEAIRRDGLVISRRWL